VDENGIDIPQTAVTAEITGEQLDLTFRDVPKPAFLSFNRDYSFYGIFTDRTETPDKLAKQIHLDSNNFNRVEAMRKLTDIERIKLIRNNNADISSEWINIFTSIIKDNNIPSALKAYLLSIDEQSFDRTMLPFYRERYNARLKLMKTIASHCFDDLHKLFNSIDTYRHKPNPRNGWEERLLKSTVLRIMIEIDNPEAQGIVEKHFNQAWHISDRTSALQCINISSHPDRYTIMESAYKLWKDHLTAYTSYLSIVSGSRQEDVFSRITREEKRDSFNIQHPTHTRALYLAMAGNNKMLWTDSGIKWLADTVIKLAPINENTANGLVRSFQHVQKLSKDLKPKVLEALEKMSSNVDKSKCPSVAGRLAMYLGSSEECVGI
jgi:aminopeptidase N